MPVKDFFIIGGVKYDTHEVNEKKIKPFIKVLGKAKKELSDLLELHTPSDETSNLITDETGNICFEYSENCNKKIFVQEAQKNSYMKHVIETQNAIHF